MEETCILCGDIIPEGRQVCPICEQKYGGKLDERKAMDFLLRQSVLKADQSWSKDRRGAADHGGQADEQRPGYE